jgi:hypothetical protein
VIMEREEKLSSDEKPTPVDRVNQRNAAISRFWSQAADDGAKVYLACPDGGTLVGFIGAGLMGSIPLYVEGVRDDASEDR